MTYWSPSVVGRAASYREEDGALTMKNHDITVASDLGRGNASQTVYTCDFSLRLREDQCGVPGVMGVPDKLRTTMTVNYNRAVVVGAARAHRVRPSNASPRRHARSPISSATSHARWRVSGALKYLEAVQHVHHMDADWLVGVEAQHAQIDRNTKQFVAGKTGQQCAADGPAWYRQEFAGQGDAVALREARSAPDRSREGAFNDMPDIVDQIADEQYRFVLFCDDLSFDQVMAATRR